jgi:hypothetical protein
MLPPLYAEVRGFQELSEANRQMLEAVNPRGGLGKAVREAALFVHRYAVAITHVQTGTLQASHRIDFASGRVLTSFAGFEILSEAAARIYIDPGTRNPVTGQRPADYGHTEHARGGTHAFYQRAHSEAGPNALLMAHYTLLSALPKGSSYGSALIRVGGSVLAELPTRL